MTKATERHAEMKEKSKDRLASDIETLRSTLSQLRDDMTQLLDTTLGVGRSGAGMLKDRAGVLEDRGVESVERFGQKIGERPLLSAAIALGIGFVLARVLTPRR